MPTKDRRTFPTHLYPKDIVQCTFPDALGVIQSCWWDDYDESTPPPRPLEEGEFLVSFFVEPTVSEIKSASELRMVDRNFRTGDICQRVGSDDPQPGTVIDARVKSLLAHAISGKEIPGWKTKVDFELPCQPEVGEYVTYDNWIGQVIEVYDEVLVEDATNNLVVKINQLGSGLHIGERELGLVSTQSSSLMNHADTVIGVVHTVYAIAWLAINQSLDPDQTEERQRPQRFWAGKELHKLAMLTLPSDLEPSVGDRVRLKSDIGAFVTQHGPGERGHGSYTVSTYRIVETETEVDIMWQDGVTETLLARDLLPQLNSDEHECWPGQYALWKVDDVTNSVVVQSVNAAERTAIVLLVDNGTKELVSLLELDRSGTDPFTSDHTPMADTLGVDISDLVLIHKPGKTNGCADLRVARIGEIESWLREPDVPNDGLSHTLAWRREMSELGVELAKTESFCGFDNLDFYKVAPGDERYLWFGEVLGLNLDGTAVVRHVEGTTRTYPTERLSKLAGGNAFMHADFEDQTYAYASSEESDDMSIIEDGQWCPVLDMNDGWVGQDNKVDDKDACLNGSGTIDCDTMDIDVDHLKSAVPRTGFSIALPASPSQDPIWNELAEGARVMNNIPADGTGNVTHMIYPPPSTTSPVRLQPPAIHGASAASLSREFVYKYRTKIDVAGINFSEENEHVKELSWKRFDILPCAPVDHAFHCDPPDLPGKVFMTRLYREYRALENGLPDTIIVRAFEDRLDLLRCLIIGPENTPYEDAPFVIDWRLDSTFPKCPPIAHFLSWTNGNGRVNPNLYEEGKVCLSLLGTWEGDRNESWNPARSSLLQIFVSIQGLILVKEPWYCEPGFERFRGTEEGMNNSRLYSEKAYVFSRGFVRHALAIPPGGLEEDIRFFYHGARRLRTVIEKSRALIEKSRRDPNPSKEQLQKDETADIAIPRLSVGGIIMLERNLNALQEASDAWDSTN